MARREFVIQICDRRVRVNAGRGESDGWVERAVDANSLDVPAKTLAAEISAALDESGNPAGRATLVLPSSWCYLHEVHVPQRRPSRQALAYALEEFTPIEIERLTCDFLPAPGARRVGVAIETAPTRALLDSLAVHALEIDRITIDILHACDQTPDCRELLWCDVEHVTRLSRNGAGVNLRVLRLSATSDGAWLDRIQSLRNGPPTGRARVVGVLGPDRMRELAERLLETRVDVGEVSSSESDAATDRSRSPALVPGPANDVDEAPGDLDLDGLNAPPARPVRRFRFDGFDLARDALAPASGRTEAFRIVRRAALAVTVAGLILCVALAVHRARLQQRLDQIAGWERQVFEQALPGQEAPRAVALRFASERRRLEGLTLANPAAPRRTDALRSLQAIVAGLPTDLRLDLDEIRIDGADVTLRGRTRDHHQAERLTKSLDRLDGVDCSAPRTDRRREGGVQFFAHAKLVPSAPPGEARAATAQPSSGHANTQPAARRTAPVRNPEPADAVLDRKAKAPGNLESDPAAGDPKPRRTRPQTAAPRRERARPEQRGKP